MLSTDQSRTRCVSEPPSFPRLDYSKTSDPSGRYKGSNYNPHWSQNRSHTGRGGPPMFSLDSSSTDAPAPTRNRLNGYTNHYGSNSSSTGNGNGPTSAPLLSQMSGSRGYDSPYGSGRKSPRSPSPTKRDVPVSTGLTPTGPASMKTSVPPRADQWSSSASRSSIIDATTSEYNTAAESRSDPKAESTPSTSPGVNSPSYKVHPSRLNLVPQATPSVSSPMNPARTLTSVSVSTPSRDASSSRSSRPAPLNLTPAGTPKEAIKTPATAAWSPSLVLSPATKSPLDSLDKLRRFKEQVAASRKSVNSMSGLEMSKLAQVAETFLKSQDREASDQAYEQLVKLTGSREVQSSGPPEPAEKPPPPPTVPPPAPPATDGAKDMTETVQSAAARAAILKERLLASKRDGSSQSPRGQDAPRRTEGNAEQNASTGAKRDREDRPENENDEQKRYRAAVWAHQKPAEPEKRDQQDRHSVRSEREEGEWDGYDSRSSAPQPQRMERQLSLNERISDRTRPSSNDHGHGHENGHGHGHRRVSPSPDQRDRHRQDDYARPPPASSERSHETHSVPPPRGPSGYAQSRDASMHQYAHKPRPTGPSHDVHYRSTPPGAAAQAIALKQDESAYEARRLARLNSLQTSPTRSEYSRSRPSAPPAPQTYARAVVEPRGYREDPYARSVTSEYHRHQETAPAPGPAPAPAPVAAPIAVIDPATVLATLDVLKAQIATLEKLLPAALPAIVAAPAQAPIGQVYGYGYERDHPPPPPPPRPHHHGHGHEHGHEHGHGHGHGYAPPGPPPQRAYAYEQLPPPPAPHHTHGSPPRELHTRIQPGAGTEPWLNRPPPKRERGGPYKEKGGYKGRDEYREEHGHGHGHGNGRGHEKGGRGRGGRGGKRRGQE